MNEKGLTNEQKIAFLQFVIDVYTMEFDALSLKYKHYYLGSPRVKASGFCYLFSKYFERHIAFHSEVESAIPELLKYKPKVFYTLMGEESSDDTWWWFPRGENKKRIKIAKALIKQLRQV